MLDREGCYAAAASRDARFDGWFVTAVRTTGIYCRPSCPAVTPKRHNVDFFATAAAAHQSGFRACKRCRPDTSPGSPEWNVRADVVARAMRLIADGAVDRDGVRGLAAHLGYSERQLNRLMTGELGAGPLAIARAQRAQTARILIETTDMTFADVAAAAGFGSIRQFNDTVREVFATAPGAMRARRRDPAASGEPAVGERASPITVRLAVRRPFAADRVLGFLGRRAVPGVESWDGATYSRSMRLPRGNGVVSLHAGGDDAIVCALHLEAVADLQSAIQRCRRLLDLDADPVAVDDHLAGDALLGPLVGARPGLRSPGHTDGDELLVRALLGQQVSVAAARTLTAGLVRAAGELLAAPVGAVTHAFPTPVAIVTAGPAVLPLPAFRRQAIVTACAALADGSLRIDAGSDRSDLRRRLCALPGIGAWTADYVALRALGDPDVFMPADLGVRRALERHGLPGTARAAAATAERWHPWRSYALHHLWEAA